MSAAGRDCENPTASGAPPSTRGASVAEFGLSRVYADLAQDIERAAALFIIGHIAAGGCSRDRHNLAETLMLLQAIARARAAQHRQSLQPSNVVALDSRRGLWPSS